MTSTTSRTRRVALSALAAATALSMLAACGSGTPGQPAPGGEGEGEGETSTVHFWQRTFTPAENDWYQSVVEKFNDAQDEYNVVLTEVPADAWDQKMKAAQAAGNAPDIYTHSGPIQDSVGAGQLHELNGIVSDTALGEIIDVAKPVSAVGDTFYAYPLLLEPQTVLFWNKEILSAAGLDPEVGPTTWEEMFDMCERIVPTLAAGQFCIEPAGDAVTFAWSTHGQQYNFSGTTALTPDWTAPAIDNPGFRDLMAKYKTMWDEGYMPKQADDWYGGAKVFGAGKSAFKASGSWLMSEIGTDYPEMLHQIGISRFVSSEAGNGSTATTLGNFKWVVDAKAKNPEGAGAFLEWALGGDPQNLVEFFVVTQFTKVPVRTSVQDAVAADQAAADAPWSSVIVNEVAPDAIPEPTFPWDVSLAVGTAMESVMKGTANPDSAIDTAVREIQTVIDREGLPAKAPAN